MKYINKITFTLIALLAFSLTAHAADINSMSQIEINLNSVNNNTKLSAVYWLPDFQSSMTSSSNTAGGGSGDEITKCEDFAGHISTIPTNHVCNETHPGNDFTCYKNCRCPSKYDTSSCNLPGQKLSNDCCTNNGVKKCTGCVNKTCTEINSTYSANNDIYKDCTEKKFKDASGYADFSCYSCVNCDTSYNKTNTICKNEHPGFDKWEVNKTPTCGQKYKTCTCTANNNCNGYSLTDPNCPSHYKTLECNNGCQKTYKCAAKTCAEINSSYLTSNNINKKCTEKSFANKENPSSPLRCYSCVDCGTDYTQTEATCKSSHAGYHNWTHNNNKCGQKYNGCACTPSTTKCAGYTLSSSDACPYNHRKTSCNNGCENKYKCLPATCYEAGLESSIPTGKLCKTVPIIGMNSNTINCYNNCDCNSQIYTQGSECSNLVCVLHGHGKRDHTSTYNNKMLLRNSSANNSFIINDCARKGVSKVPSAPRYCINNNGRKHYQACSCSTSYYPTVSGASYCGRGHSSKRNQWAHFCTVNNVTRCQLVYHSVDGVHIIGK